jgi:hypothetical protein
MGVDKPAYENLSYERPWKEDKEHRKGKTELVKALVAIDELDDQGRVARQKVETKLTEARTALGDLARRYPEDKDVRWLLIAYADLETDFRDSGELKLDDSFYLIAEEMEGLINRLGIVKVSPDRVKDHPATNQAIADLRAQGIDVAYVRKSTNPNARPVVLFLQNHIMTRGAGNAVQDELTTLAGVPQSQAEISQAIQTGVSDTVFLEGFAVGNHKYTPEDIRAMRADPKKWDAFSPVEQTALLRLEKGEITLRGFEYFTEGASRGKYMPYRTSGQNVFIAQSIAQGLDVTGTGLPSAVIGAAHEAPAMGTQRGILPLSSVLAAYGMDVIVVDMATKHRNEAGLLRYTEDHLGEVERTLRR